MRAFSWAVLTAVSVLVTAPVAAAPVRVSSWYQPLSEPQARARTVPSIYTGAERVLEVPESQHVTWTPVRPDLLGYPRRQPAVSFATGAERVLEVPESQHTTWYRPLSEPRNRDRAPIAWLTGAEQPVRVAPVTLPDIEWARALSEPTRRRPVVDFRTGAEFPAKVTLRTALPAIGWHVPLNEPPRREARPPVWFSPLSLVLGQGAAAFVPAPSDQQVIVAFQNRGVRVDYERREAFVAAHARGGAAVLASPLVSTFGEGHLGGDAVTPGVETSGATFIVAVASWAVVPASVVDNKGNTYARIDDYGADAGHSVFVAVGTPTVGTNHIFTAGGGFASSLCVAAFAAPTLPTVDDDNAQASASAAALSTGSVTPRANGALLIAAWSTNNNTGAADAAIDSGFEILENAPAVAASHVGCALAYLLQPTAAAINPQWSQPGASAVAASLTSFV